MRVLKDKILIERCKKEEAKSTILIVKNEKPSSIFEVKDVGPDVQGVFSGDRVIVGQYSPLQIENDEKRDIYVIFDKDVLVVL